MKVFVYIDPGVHGCGVAAFGDNELLTAAYVNGLGGAHHPLLEVVGPVAAWVENLGVPVHTVMIEKPKVYDAAFQKGDQRDIVNLAVVVGALASKLNLPTALREPWEWKGQTPKDVTTARAKAVLEPEELAGIDMPRLKSLEHNVWDAVAMGLQFHGRIK
jgi:hypothetical protein